MNAKGDSEWKIVATQVGEQRAFAFSSRESLEDFDTVVGVLCARFGASISSAPASPYNNVCTLFVRGMTVVIVQDSLDGLFLYSKSSDSEQAFDLLARELRAELETFH
jgi:hypothetical protein